MTDENDRILYTHYGPNNGNPVGAVREAFADFIRNAWPLGPIPASWEAALQAMAKTYQGSFSLNTGIIETIAHYLAAKKINDKVSFILDIGGQDMKASLSITAY